MKAKALLIILVISGLGWSAQAQGPRVPAKMEFAGMKLKIAEGARKEIQADVDLLTKSPKYFNIKVQRANTYFPIIERVFKEERLPEDFKYLVLQESALIPDAVSSSNAVGFWQFKDFTAQEVGLRVDRYVDERMNIVASTRGAARYLKKNNFYFDNWLLALQAYQMGAGGVQRAIGNRYNGARAMEINKKTYWYIKKYLAHKVAFELAVNHGRIDIEVVEYKGGVNKSLDDIAEETGVAEDDVKAYNKWLKRGKVPNDKEYVLLLPSKGVKPIVLANAKKPDPKPLKYVTQYDERQSDKYPIVVQKKSILTNKAFTKVNGLPGIVAQEGDGLVKLAEKADLSLGKFLNYNDLEINQKPIAGQVYYLKPKKTKAKAHYHTVKEGETIWAISQKYGVRLKKILNKNRMQKAEALKVGRVLWLRYIRPPHVPVEHKKVKQPLPVNDVATVQKQPVPPAKQEPKIEGKIEENPVESKSSEKVEPKTQVITLEEPKAVSDSIKVNVEPNLTKAGIGEPTVTPTETTTAKIPDNEVKEVAEEQKTPVEDKPLKGRAVEKDPSDERSNEMVAGEVTPVELVHTVMQGETLYGLAKQYGVNVHNIVEWNGIKVQDGLSIGQKLKIKTFREEGHKAETNGAIVVEQAPKETTALYEVKTGDTLYKIARSHGITIKKLMEWNGKKDFNLSLGEKLKIKKTVSNTN